MSYRIILNIAEDSEIGRLIESVATREQLSREEAALRLSQGNRNGGASEAAQETAEERRLAAIKSFAGCLKEENAQLADAMWHHFDEEHYEDIERENARDIC